MKPTEFGIFVACVAHGIAPDDFPTVKSAAEGISNLPGADVLGRQVAGFARDIFATAGHSGDFEAHLYDQLSKTASWEPAHFEFLEPVYSVLGRHHQLMQEVQKQATNEQSIKNASAFLSKLGEGLATIPGSVLGTSVVGGAGLGSIYWALNRGAQGDDADAVSMQSKIEYYDKIRKEIADELKRNPPAALRKSMRNSLEKAENPGYAL